jgi:hypothetical protein
MARQYYRDPTTQAFVALDAIPGPVGPTGPTGPEGPIGTGLDEVAANDLFVNVSGDTMTGPLLLPTGPTLPLEAATKQYVDESTPDVYYGTASPPGGTSYKPGDIYAQYT